MVPTAWVHPLLTSGRCLVERATQWLSPISFQEQVFLREQDGPSDIYKWAHRSVDNLAVSSVNSTHLHTQEHIHLPCMGNQLGTVFQGSFTPRRGEERDVHVSQNLYDKWWVTTTKESIAAPTDSALCAAALNTGTFSQAGKRDRDTVISSKDAVRALMPLVNNFPTLDTSCPSLLAAASLFLPTPIFWNNTFKESLVRGWRLWPGVLWPAGFRVRHARLHQSCRTSLQVDFFVC